MKAEDLKQKQEELFEQIKRHADLLGLSGRNWHPIQDGVYNVEEYLKAPIRIMWVMKEAYDGEDEKGNPCGGEWSIFDIIDEGKPFPKSWSNIIYTTYNNELSADEIIDFCASKYNIHIIASQTHDKRFGTKQTKKIHENGMLVYKHTIDNVLTMAKFAVKDVDGYYTNMISPEEMERVTN